MRLLDYWADEEAGGWELYATWVCTCGHRSAMNWRVEYGAPIDKHVMCLCGISGIIALPTGAVDRGKQRALEMLAAREAGTPLAKSLDYAKQAQAILDSTPIDDTIARALVYALLANAAALRART